jgi:hypothetical protein
MLVISAVFLVSFVTTVALIVYDMTRDSFPFYTPRWLKWGVNGGLCSALVTALLLIVLVFALGILEVNGVKP